MTKFSSKLTASEQYWLSHIFETIQLLWERYPLPGSPTAINPNSKHFTILIDHPPTTTVHPQIWQHIQTQISYRLGCDPADIRLEWHAPTSPAKLIVPFNSQLFNKVTTWLDYRYQHLNKHLFDELNNAYHIHKEKFYIISFGNKNKYIQWIWNDTRQLHLELISEQFLPASEHYSKKQIQSINHLGWHHPYEDQYNYYQIHIIDHPKQLKPLADILDQSFKKILDYQPYHQLKWQIG